MKKRSVSQVVFLLVLLSVSFLTVSSCSKDLCPTYQAPMERVKSIRAQEINGSWERKSVPSPKTDKNKDQRKRTDI